MDKKPGDSEEILLPELPVVHISRDEYIQIGKSDWPLNSFMEKYGPYVKLVLPTEFHLFEASCFQLYKYVDCEIDIILKSGYTKTSLQVIKHDH